MCQAAHQVTERRPTNPTHSWADASLHHPRSHSQRLKIFPLRRPCFIAFFVVGQECAERRTCIVPVREHLSLREGLVIVNIPVR